jgi:hypothetical protein
VVLVDDVVARPQVGEALKRAAEADVGPGRALTEDLGVGQKDEPELTVDEAAAGRRDDEGERGLLR